MSSERKYVHIKDWLAVKELGEDPGLRPLGDELFLTSEPSSASALVAAASGRARDHKTQPFEVEAGAVSALGYNPPPCLETG